MKTIDFDTINSTNTYLKENYQMLDNMTFVSAKSQTHGHGRNKRIWKSEKGSNLLFSLLLTNNIYFDRYKELSIISAYSIIKVLEEYGLKPMLKWPNDIYINDKKICGILLEGISRERIECLIIGIGINVNQMIFDDDLIHEPTSLKKELGDEIDLEEFKKRIYSSIEKYLYDFLNNDYYEEIEKYDYLKNKTVYAYIDEIKEQIEVIGIDRDYQLIIIDKDDNKRLLDNGEISFHI